MKGQQLMKHSTDLIGRKVHVFQMTGNRPDIPRSGTITGFGPQKGLFCVNIERNYNLDIKAGLPAFGFISGCLVIDDSDDIPIGVTEYARLLGELKSSQESRLAADLSFVADGSETSTEPEKAEPDKEEDGSGAEESEAAEETEKAEPSTKQTEIPPPGDTAFDILMKTDAWKPIDEIDNLAITQIGKNELSITIMNDDKPIARMIWVPRGTASNEITTGAHGFTIRLRDKAGRCSKILSKNLTTPQEVERAVEHLAAAIKLGMDAELGDWGSSAANMDAIVNKSRIEE